MHMVEDTKVSHTGVASSLSSIGEFKTHSDAEQAVRELSDAGFNIKHLSIKGEGYHVSELVLGTYGIRARMSLWAKRASMFAGAWFILFGPYTIMVPNAETVLDLPLEWWLIALVEFIVIWALIGAIAGAVYSMSKQHRQQLRFEKRLLCDWYEVIAHGSIDDCEKARSILNQAGLLSMASTPAQPIAAES
jgi:hypothetical protein